MNFFTIDAKLLNKDLLKYYENVNTRKGDSGFDLYFPSDVFVPPNVMGMKVGLGISCECYLNSKPSSFWLLPRSSISKTPVRMSNSLGLIDSTYRGELIVPLDNLSNNPFTIKEGTRLFQLASPCLATNVKFSIVEELSTTERNDGGFGSTGV